MKIAIIDLGTNTFNLLVVDYANGVSTRIHSSKIAVKLGEGGFSEKLIREDAFNRGILAFREHMEIVKSLGCDQVYAFATSAVRGASNGKKFAKTIQKQFSVKIDVIDGNREASLIYEGVRASGILKDENVLIMDIGGGSTEFIIGNKDKIFWKESFQLGAARLLEQFTPGDPIVNADILVIENHLRMAVENLMAALKEFPTQILVGSSGSFDSLVDMINASQGKEPSSETNPFNPIPTADFINLHEMLLKTTKEQRFSIPGLLPLRVDFIVIASVFVHMIIKECNIRELWQSGFALKEGVLEELKKTVLNG